MRKTSQHRIDYTERWIKEHRARRRYVDTRSRARAFIRRFATIDDLKQVITKAKKRYHEI